jgi:O-antigen/teichoic acid export membrane protein
MRGGPVYLALESFLYPALLFIFTPYLVSAIGGEYYGVWSYANAVIGAGSILSFGMSIAAIQILSAEVTLPNRERFEASVRSVLLLFLSQGVIVAIVAGAMVLSLVLKSEVHSYLLICLLLNVVVLSVLDQMDSALSSILRAGQHFSAILRYDLVIRLLQLGLSVFTATLFGFESMLLCFVTFSILRMIIKYQITNNLIFLGMTLRGELCIAPLIRSAKYGWLQGVFGGVMLFADRIFAGNILGPKAVALLAVLNLVPQQLHAISVSAISYILPRINSKRVTGVQGWQEARDGVIKLTKIIFLVSIIVLAVAHELADLFLQIWLKDRFGKANGELFFLILISYCLQALNAPSYFLLTAYAKNKSTTVAMAFSGLISLGLVYPFLANFGIYGAAWAKIIYGVLSLSLVGLVLKDRYEIRANI